MHVPALVLAIVPCTVLAEQVIDGRFDDWAATLPAIIDPVDAISAFVDFGEVRIRSSSRHVHLLVDLGATVNAQGLHGQVLMVFDADDNPATGHREHGVDGVDLVISLTPPDPARPGEPGFGIAVRSSAVVPGPIDPGSPKITPYNINLLFGPTHAGRRMEFRWDRGVQLPTSPALFTAPAFAVRLVAVNPAGEMVDQTDIARHELPALDGEPPEPAQERDPLARDQATAFRVMTWNVRRSAFLSQPRPFIAILAATDPDIVLLQEITDEVSAAQIEEFFNTLPGQNGASWTALIGAGSDLRAAVVSRYPIVLAPSFAAVPVSSDADRLTRTAGGIVQTSAGRVLVVSAHLKCCGRAGDSSDQTRMQEAESIGAAMSRTIEAESVDAIVLAGDLNLVGSREPLEILAHGADLDRSMLSIADPLQIDGASNATWADPEQPFAPGRLDYLLYSDSAIAVMRQVVFDSQDLSAKWLEVHGMRPDDTERASDHLPVVVDFAWTSWKAPAPK